MLHPPWAKGTKLSWESFLLKVSSLPAASLAVQCPVSPSPVAPLAVVLLGKSARPQRLPAQSQAGSCFPGTQVSALILSQPRGFILQKTMFLSAFEAGTVLAQSLLLDLCMFSASLGFL